MQSILDFFISTFYAFQGLSFSEVTTLLMILITGVYTIGTFLLYKSHKHSLNLIEQQIKLVNSQIQSQSYHSIINNHREIILSIMSNKDILNTISNNFGHDDSKNFINDFIATLFINHILTVYINYQNKLLTEEQWSFAKIDVSDLFKLEFIKNRWQKIKNYYPQDFTIAIENIIFSPKKDFGNN